MLNVPINIPIIGREEQKEVLSVLKNRFLTSAANLGGPNVQEFENNAKQFLKAKYTIAVNSGTAALQAALLALDIKKGDEVIIPSFTFVATANSVLSTGAKPVFVDILKNNFTIDPNQIKKKITKRTKAIVPVNLYGNMSFIEEIKETSSKKDIHVIEDSAQSMGTTYKGKQSGTMGDIGCFSLYPAKVMTAGEGGLIVTNNKEFWEKLLMIRNHGMVHGYDTRIFGLNLRLPEISAAIAKIQIKKLPLFLAKRRKNAQVLSELLSDTGLELPKERKFEKVNWYLYTITSKNRDKIQQQLNKNGIGASVYYKIPIHKTPYYNKKTNLPVTEWASYNTLCLPIHPKVSIKNLEMMTRIIKESII